MNPLRKSWIFIGRHLRAIYLALPLIYIASTPLLGCGVKGDPLPPEKAVFIGRGRPSYKQATEDLPLPQLPHLHDDEEDEVEDEEPEDED